MGASSGGSLFTGPAFFQIAPICFRAASALSSNRPSVLGATFRIKLQLAVFSGLSVSFTSFTGSLTAVVGKSVFQNHELCSGRQASAGILLLSLEIRCPAPIS